MIGKAVPRYAEGIMELKDYREELYDIFARNTHRGFIDWRNCGNLEYEVCTLLEHAAERMLSADMDKELFDLVCKAYVKWAGTEKDDSCGETQSFVSSAFGIWDQIYERKNKKIDHGKMLAWILKKMDGSIIDYMEDSLLEYMMAHFKEPDLQQKKLDYMNARLEEKTKLLAEKSWMIYDVQRSREYILQIYGEQKRPIEEIREYAKDIDRESARELLAKIELEYGNPKEAIEIYKELANISNRPWDSKNYNETLKELYRKYGYQAEYEAQVRKLLYIKTGDPVLWEEYKALIPGAEWPEAVNHLFASFSPADSGPFPWYQAEGRYDLIMIGIEYSGPWSLETYEGELMQRYPERCLEVLVKAADREAENSKNRKDYRHIAGYLKWMWRYPNGRKRAAELAEIYRKRYPRRIAMIDELKGI